MIGRQVFDAGMFAVALVGGLGVARAEPVEPVKQAKPASQDKPTWKITGEPGKGLTVTTGDRFALNLQSRIQVRYQLNIPAPDDNVRLVRRMQAARSITVMSQPMWFSNGAVLPCKRSMWHARLPRT